MSETTTVLSLDMRDNSHQVYPLMRLSKL